MKPAHPQPEPWVWEFRGGWGRESSHRGPCDALSECLPPAPAMLLLLVWSPGPQVFHEQELQMAPVFGELRPLNLPGASHGLTRLIQTIRGNWAAASWCRHGG